MSHELRTPLNAIIGYSEMLLEDCEDLGNDDMIPDLKRITNSSKHLLSLINNVLDLSKIEAGRVELFNETFELKQILNDVIKTSSPLAQKNDNESFEDMLEKEIASEINILPEKSPKTSAEDLFND